MFGKDDDRKSGGAETIIGPTVKVDGKFFGKGNVVVQGQVFGSMKTHEDLQVDQNAVVKASVEARNIVVAGEIHGNVKALERLELTETAKLFGDVEAKTISMGAGAVLNGKCTMTEAAASTAASAYPPQQNFKQQKNRKAEAPV